MKDWVDFKEVKDRVTMQMVLDHYQINWLRTSGEELRGRCPIHEGEGQRTFHVNLSKNAFYCFSCKAKGNVLDFTAAMEDVSVRDAALKLAEWFGLGQAESRGGDTPQKPPRRQPRSDRATSQKAETVEEPAESELVINPPLGFELKVDPGHEYGTSRGFSGELLEQFGVGYCLSKLNEGIRTRRGFLYTTTDGLEWNYVTEFMAAGVSETTLRFMPDDEMIALVRPGWIGRSRPPYKWWQFHKMKHAIGGPNFIRLPDGGLWASARRYHEDGATTVLAKMTPESYEPVLTLPSGGDTSYPGMVWHRFS